MRQRVRDVTVGRFDMLTVREDLARRYLKGSGLEIGAAHRPLRMPPGADVRYVDRSSADEIKQRYPEWANHWLVPIDVIDDASTLQTVPDASQDFVVANHVLEHLEDPISALRSWMRVLRPDGIAYLALPDKRRTFDAARPSTTIEHLERDERDGPEWSRSAHYTEYVRLAEQRPEGEVAGRAAELEARRDDIHFHVWSQPELIEFLLHARTLDGMAYELESVQANDGEVLIILVRGVEALDSEVIGRGLR